LCVFGLKNYSKNNQITDLRKLYYLLFCNLEIKMLKKSILLENKASISTKNLQLVIKTETRESTISIEDIGYLVIDHPEIILIFLLPKY
jgi:hypothetical protein